VTLKYENLEAILNEIRRLGYTNEVPENTLDKVIMRRMGLSTFVISNTKRALRKAELMEPAAIGFWKFCNPTEEAAVKSAAAAEIDDYEQAKSYAEQKQELD